MIKFITIVLMAALILTFQYCSNSPNILSGKWKSLVPVSENKSFDFNITFENNNTFHIEVTGGGLTETVKGGYKIWDDTMIINDDLDKPLHLCDYIDTGKYKFAAYGDTVYFKTIKDNCERRKLTLELGLLKSK